MRARFHSPIRFCIPNKVVRANVWILGLVLCVPAVQAASLPRPHHQPKEIVRTIEKLERQWQHAELTADTAVMAAMLSEDYLGIYGDGTLATRGETLESFKNRTTRFSEVYTFDRKIRVFGSTVVVVSKARANGVHDGEAISGLYRYTRVYHRHNGVWKIVSFEASAIHPHGPGHGPNAGAGAAPGPGSQPEPVVPPE
jgi:ketosteroid isomerase-like protein